MSFNTLKANTLVTDLLSGGTLIVNGVDIEGDKNSLEDKLQHYVSSGIEDNLTTLDSEVICDYLIARTGNISTNYLSLRNLYTMAYPYLTINGNLAQTLLPNTNAVNHLFCKESLTMSNTTTFTKTVFQVTNTNSSSGTQLDLGRERTGSNISYGSWIYNYSTTTPYVGLRAHVSAQQALQVYSSYCDLAPSSTVRLNSVSIYGTRTNGPHTFTNTSATQTGQLIGNASSCVEIDISFSNIKSNGCIILIQFSNSSTFTDLNQWVYTGCGYRSQNWNANTSTISCSSDVDSLGIPIIFPQENRDTQFTQSGTLQLYRLGTIDNKQYWTFICRAGGIGTPLVNSFIQGTMISPASKPATYYRLFIKTMSTTTTCLLRSGNTGATFFS